jgi:hypothetical protein
LAKGEFERFQVVSLNKREKIFTKLNTFILLFTSYLMSNAPKTMELRFPRTSRLSHLPSIFPSIAAASFWLVVVFKIIDRQPFKAVVYFIFVSFSLLNLTPQTMGRCPPCGLLAQSALTPPLPLPPTIGLIVV